MLTVPLWGPTFAMDPLRPSTAPVELALPLSPLIRSVCNARIVNLMVYSGMNTRPIHKLGQSILAFERPASRFGGFRL